MLPHSQEQLGTLLPIGAASNRFFGSYLDEQIILLLVAKKRGPGRPKHADPPKMLATNIPASVYDRLDRLAEATGQPKSVHLEAALRAYLRRPRSPKIKPRGNP